MLECIYFFIIGAFAGWMLECVFKFMAGHFTKTPGILNTPFCILYGLGTVVLSMVISRVTTNYGMLFLFSMLALTIMEYVTFILLEDLYGIQLWDYSDMTFRINEKVCLEFSLIWGLLGASYIKYLLPLFKAFFVAAQGPVLTASIYLIFGIIFVDFIYSNFKLLRHKKAALTNANN